MDNETRQEIELLKAEIAALKDDRLPKVDRASKRRDKRQVFAGVGLFAVALLAAGTMSASALSGTNTVDSGDIVDGTITNSDIKSDAILGSRVRNDSLTGADINESMLVLTCPSGMLQARDVCYSSSAATGNFTVAFEACNTAGLRLPSLSEGVLVAKAIGSDSVYWTDARFTNGSTQYAMFAGKDPGASVGFDIATSLSYRCVTTIGARP